MFHEKLCDLQKKLGVYYRAHKSIRVVILCVSKPFRLGIISGYVLTKKSIIFTQQGKNIFLISFVTFIANFKCPKSTLGGE